MELIVSRSVCDDPKSWSLQFIRMNRFPYVSIPSLFLWIVQVIVYLNAKLSTLFLIYQWFFILFPNHKPCTNSSITIYPESSVKAVTPVHIFTFICYAYSGRNGDTMHSSKVNDIGQKLDSKQWVSVLLYFSVAYVLQITLSWFLCTLLIVRRSPVLLLNITLFKMSSGKYFLVNYL